MKVFSNFLAIGTVALLASSASAFPVFGSSVSSLAPRGHILKSGGTYETWTKFKNDKKEVIIPYCYRDQDDYDELKDVMKEATDMWHEALKSKAAIKFEDISMVDNKRQFCVGGGDWNPKLAKWNGCLVLSYAKGFKGSYLAGQGYDPDEKNNGFYRNQVFLDPDQYNTGLGDDDYDQTPEAGLAHELGHVIGLAHAHQRKDAANHIKFDCKNLDDYDAAKKWIEDSKNKADWTIDEACKDVLIADKTLPDGKKFSAGQYAPFSSDVETFGDFDEESIMIYSSHAGSKDVDGGKYPLVDKNGGKIFAQDLPSDGDVKAVAKLYPL